MTRNWIVVACAVFVFGCSTVTSSSSELVFEHFEEGDQSLEITGIGPEAREGVFDQIELSYDNGTAERVVRIWDEGVATAADDPLYTEIDAGLMQQLEVIVEEQNRRGSAAPFSDRDEARLMMIAQALATLQARRSQGEIFRADTCVERGNVWDCIAAEHF